MNKALTSLSGDITVLKDQVSSLRAFAPDEEGQIEAINQIAALEDRIRELEGKTNAAMMASQRSSAASNDEVRKLLQGNNNTTPRQLLTLLLSQAD